jgi:hypothetical protein
MLQCQVFLNFSFDVNWISMVYNLLPMNGFDMKPSSFLSEKEQKLASLIKVSVN